MGGDFFIYQDEAGLLVMEGIVANYCPPDAVEVPDETG